MMWFMEGFAMSAGGGKNFDEAGEAEVRVLAESITAGAGPLSTKRHRESGRVLVLEGNQRTRYAGA